MEILTPLAGNQISHWSRAAQHIIEDSVLLQPKIAIRRLREMGLERNDAIDLVADMQKRFEWHDEDSDRLIAPSGKPLNTLDLILIRMSLENSVFLTHGMHVQPHLTADDYYQAAHQLEDDFKVIIPS